jgi:hypothetical protein
MVFLAYQVISLRERIAFGANWGRTVVGSLIDPELGPELLSGNRLSARRQIGKRLPGVGAVGKVPDVGTAGVTGRQPGYVDQRG